MANTPRKRGRPSANEPIEEGASVFKRWRTTVGLTQEQAAELLGVDKRTIQAYDTGLSKVSGKPQEPTKAQLMIMWAYANGVHLEPWREGDKTAPEAAPRASVAVVSQGSTYTATGAIGQHRVSMTVVSTTDAHPTTRLHIGADDERCAVLISEVPIGGAD